MKESKQVIFNGDNYSEAWHTEAGCRGLPNRRTAIDSLPDLISAKAGKLFTKYGIFNERELHSRYEIFLESYHKTINIESQLTIQIAQRMILPRAPLRYQLQVAESVVNPKVAGGTVPKSQSAPLSDLVEAIDDLQEATDRLTAATDEVERGRFAGTTPGIRRDAIIPRDDRRPRRRRPPRGDRRRRPLAPADLPGDAVRQVTDRSLGDTPTSFNEAGRRG